MAAVGRGEFVPATGDVCLGLVEFRVDLIGAGARLGAEVERQRHRSLSFRTVGKRSEADDFGILAGLRIARGEDRLQPSRADGKLLGEIAARGVDAKHLQHAVERIERHIVGSRHLFDHVADLGGVVAMVRSSVRRPS